MQYPKDWLADEIARATRPLPELPNPTGQWWQKWLERRNEPLSAFADWLKYQPWKVEDCGDGEFRFISSLDAMFGRFPAIDPHLGLNPLVEAVFRKIIDRHGEKFFKAIRRTGVKIANGPMPGYSIIMLETAEKLNEFCCVVDPPDAATGRTIFDCLIQSLKLSTATEAEPAKTPLTDKELCVVKILAACPPRQGRIGKNIISDAVKMGEAIEQSELTKRLIPALNAKGVAIKNARLAGYYLSDAKQHEQFRAQFARK